MFRPVKKRWMLFGAVVGGGGMLALVVSLGAGAGSAAVSAAPTNTSPPTITGTAQAGQKLVGHRGHLDWQPDGLQRLLGALRQERG